MCASRKISEYLYAYNPAGQQHGAKTWKWRATAEDAVLEIAMGSSPCIPPCLEMPYTQKGCGNAGDKEWKKFGS